MISRESREHFPWSGAQGDIQLLAAGDQKWGSFSLHFFVVHAFSFLLPNERSSAVPPRPLNTS